LAVVFRLGRFTKVRGPGIFILWPGIDKMSKVSLRVLAMDVPPQDVITKDNISIKVNAVAYFRVFEPSKAILEVEDYLYATSQLSQTTLRSVLGEYELDEILMQREKINMRLQKILDQSTDPWGIKVSAVEIKHVDIPQDMQRAIARQAEAERERRAKVIHATGELQAADKLNRAAKIISETATGIQLRFLQTLSEIATEKNSTVVFPVPIDLFTPFIKKLNEKE
jgi:regulator of protease activity HflC (stomatin/prohibitin superfamily)